MSVPPLLPPPSTRAVVAVSGNPVEDGVEDDLLEHRVVIRRVISRANVSGSGTRMQVCHACLA